MVHPIIIRLIMLYKRVYFRIDDCGFSMRIISIGLLKYSVTNNSANKRNNRMCKVIM